MTRVYVGCPIRHRDEAKALAERLRAAGHEVVSDWIRREESIAEADMPRAQRMIIAFANHAELSAADVLVAIVYPYIRGLLVEIGLAVGAGKRVIAIGDPLAPSLMADLPGVEWVGTADEALAVLGG